MNQHQQQDPRWLYRGAALWNPYTLLAWMAIVTPFDSGIALGINWKRLGRPVFMQGTIVLMC